MDQIKKFFTEQDHFAQHTGIELLNVEAGKAWAKLEIRACHMNGAKTVHGGAIFTLADFAFAVASNSHATRHGEQHHQQLDQPGYRRNPAYRRRGDLAQ